MKKQKNSFPVWLANVKTKMKTIYKISDSELNDEFASNHLKSYYEKGLTHHEAAKKYHKDCFAQ